MNYDDIVDQFLDTDDGETTASSAETSVTEPTENVNNTVKVTNSVAVAVTEEVEEEVETKIEKQEEVYEREKIHWEQVRIGLVNRDLKRKMVLLEGIRERNRKYLNQSKTNNFNFNVGEQIVQGANYHINVTLSQERRRRVINCFNFNNNNNTSTSTNKTEEEVTSSSELIPCRLELDHDGYKLSDILLLSEGISQEGLELISLQLCLDYELPPESFTSSITRILKDQIEEWGIYRGALQGTDVPFEEIGPVILRLDIIVGLTRLEDRIELSLDPKTTDTQTIRNLVKEMKIAGSTDKEFEPFKPLILHNLLEQLMMWRKAIVFGGYHRDPRTGALKFHDGDVAVLLNDSSSFAPPTMKRHPAHVSTFTPMFYNLSIEEWDRIESGRERENRRKRRTVLTGKASNIKNIGIVNNLVGTVRSPPRTLPTPASYRGTLHRIQSNKKSLLNDNDDGADDDLDVGVSDAAPSTVGVKKASIGGKKRGRKPKKQ